MRKEKVLLWVARYLVPRWLKYWALIVICVDVTTQLLDVIKIEWGESWSAFDQEQRDKISEVLKEYYSKREEN